MHAPLLLSCALIKKNDLRLRQMPSLEFPSETERKCHAEQTTIAIQSRLVFDYLTQQLSRTNP